MNASRIGQHVRRAPRYGGWYAWHLVDSEIEGAAITRCGRRMEPVTQRGAPLEYLDAEGVAPRGACLFCVPR